MLTFKKGMEDNLEIDIIVNNNQNPRLKTAIEELERSGKLFR